MSCCWFSFYHQRLFLGGYSNILGLLGSTVTCWPPSAGTAPCITSLRGKSPLGSKSPWLNSSKVFTLMLHLRYARSTTEVTILLLHLTLPVHRKEDRRRNGTHGCLCSYFYCDCITSTIQPQQKGSNIPRS